MSKLNVPEFSTFVQKATINYSIDNIKMLFDGTTIKSGMRGTNCIVILNKPNTFILEIPPNGEVEFCFNDPANHLRSYLDLCDSEVIDLIIKNEKIVLHDGQMKSNIHFCSPHIVTGFDGSGPKVSGETIHSFTLDDTFMSIWSKIKKVAPKFGKIYFVNNKNDGFMIETTDRTNKFSNGLDIKVADISVDKSVEICLDFKNMNNVMSLIEGDYSQFSMTVSYVESANAGLVSVIRDDNSEKYFLISNIEDRV